jgi:hypothetical protein
MKINPPVLTKIQHDILSFYNVIQKMNKTASSEEIFEFIKENSDVCEESYNDFTVNVKKNLNLITYSARLSKRPVDEIMRDLEGIGKIVNRLAIQEELRNLTINDK